MSRWSRESTKIHVERQGTGPPLRAPGVLRGFFLDQSLHDGVLARQRHWQSAALEAEKSRRAATDLASAAADFRAFELDPEGV